MKFWQLPFPNFTLKYTHIFLWVWKMPRVWFANFSCPEVLWEVGRRMQHFLLFSPNGYSTFLRRFVFGGLVCLFYNNCARIVALSYLPTLTMGPCSLSRKSLLIKESNILYALFFPPALQKLMKKYIWVVVLWWKNCYCSFFSVYIGVLWKLLLLGFCIQHLETLPWKESPKCFVLA